MLQKIKLFILFFIFSLNSLFSTENLRTTDFFVLTVPKSGSFLIMKLLVMLTGQNPAPLMHDFPELGGYFFPGDKSNCQISSTDLENYIKVNQAQNNFSLAHFNFSEPFQEFSKNNPGYRKIIQIRDLRDVLVSLVFYQSDIIEKESGFTNFDEKLMYLIRKDKKSLSPSLINIYRNAENATQWIIDPDAIVCRFEDLIGPQGGGSLEKKQELVVKLANRSEYSLR